MPSTHSVDEPLQVHAVPGHGAEDVLVSDAGLVYTGTEDGVIHELDPATGEVRAVGTTSGRPLGLEWLPDGRMVICDARKGLLVLDLGTGVVETLVAEVNGVPLRFCNNAAVAADGTIYFSESSKKFGIEQWKADISENTQSGRLLQRAPDGTVTVLVEGLRFANGVALSADESYVAVAESGGATVVRRWLAGPRKGRTEFLVEALPGYPDNIARGTDGLIWVTIASPLNPILGAVHRFVPGLGRFLWRLPEAVQPQVERTVRVMAFDDDGRTVHDRQFSAEAFHMATGVREQNGRVWLGSLHESAVAVFDVT